MENRLINSDWVDRRLASLEPSLDLAPNGDQAFAKLRRRDSRRRFLQSMWIGGTAAAVIAVCLALVLPAAGVCCTRPDAPPQDARYKELGSPQAPVVVEIYADFECPACAVFYRDTFPQFVAEYVKTGRVRLVHRDFPLPQHRYSNLAARYANAAGQTGQYEVVFRRLFETQKQWEENGNIEAALAPVLAPGTMARIHEMVARPDDSLTEDMRMVQRDQVNQTPTLIVTTPDGQRHKLAGAPTFSILKTYLDELTAHR